MAGISPNTRRKAPPDLGWDSHRLLSWISSSAGNLSLTHHFSTEVPSAILRAVYAAVDLEILIEADRIGLLAAEKGRSNVGAVQGLTAQCILQQTI